MLSSDKKRTFFLLFITIVSVVVVLPNFWRSGLPDWWPASPLRLGLDLKGGSYLVMRVETKEAIKSSLTSFASAIKNELKSESIPVVRTRVKGKNVIEVILLNGRKLDKAEGVIRKEYPDLVFHNKGEKLLSYKLPDKELIAIEQTAVEQSIETIRNRVDQFGVAEPLIQRSGKELIMVQLPDVTEMDEVKKTLGKVAKLDFMLVASPGREDGTVEFPVREGTTVLLEEDVLMSGDAIETAFVDINPQTNEIGVSLRFKAVGRKTFDRITADNIGRQLAIVLDGVVQSAPTIQERISGGTASITGRYTGSEAKQLSIVLRSGALPAPLKIETERTVGASLGSDSIRKGIISLIVGALFVVFFTIVWFKKSGILAISCLFLNLLFLLTLLSLFGATLTLPGMAGLILTIGIAIDANVIIFERIKEELRHGATIMAAIEAGFEKAHWTVLDANITTFLTGLVLFGFGTGPIKGFAVTLCLGILTSVFTALFVAHLGFRVFKLRNRRNELSI